MSLVCEVKWIWRGRLFNSYKLDDCDCLGLGCLNFVFIVIVVEMVRGVVWWLFDVYYRCIGCKYIFCRKLGSCCSVILYGVCNIYFVCIESIVVWYKFVLEEEFCLFFLDFVYFYCINVFFE